MGAAQDPEILARALRNPGRLVLNPTTVAGAFPYGGTSLGVVTAVDLEWDVRYYENHDPASGAFNELARRSVEVPRIAFLLDGPSWDEDVVAGAFSKTTASSALAVQDPAENRLEGTLIPGPVPATLPILFAALDPKGKSVLFRRPVIRLSLRQATAFAARRKAGLPLVIDPTPDAAWATTPYWQLARLENLTLS